MDLPKPKCKLIWNVFKVLRFLEEFYPVQNVNIEIGVY